MASPTPAQQYEGAGGGNSTRDQLLKGADSSTPIPTGAPTTEIGANDLFPQGYQPGLQPNTNPLLTYPLAPNQLGPPAPYKGQVTGLGTIPRTNPYVEGDQFKQANLPAAKIKQLQQALVQAGLLDQTTVHWGVWDVNSANAYRTVLAQANAYGANANDMLDALVTHAPAKVKGQKLPYALSNPADIAAQVSSLGSSNTAQQMTGQNLSPGETNDFVKWYQSQEAQARGAYNNLDLTTQTAYTDKPSLDAAAQAYIKAHNLDQVIAYGTASRALQFQQMLGAL